MSKLLLLNNNINNEEKNLITSYIYSTNYYNTPDFLPKDYEYIYKDEIYDENGNILRKIYSKNGEMPTKCSFYEKGRISRIDYCNLSNVNTLQQNFAYLDKLTKIKNLYFPINYTFDSLYGLFLRCSSLIEIDLSNFDTSKVTIMGSMFSYCSSLTSLDLSNFDTSKVTNMQSMFYSCSSLTSLDLSNFDTSKVTNSGYMFDNVPSNCIIKVGSKFTKTEKDTSFSGTFTRV